MIVSLDAHLRCGFSHGSHAFLDVIARVSCPLDYREHPLCFSVVHDQNLMAINKLSLVPQDAPNYRD